MYVSARFIWLKELARNRFLRNQVLRKFHFAKRNCFLFTSSQIIFHLEEWSAVVFFPSLEQMKDPKMKKYPLVSLHFSSNKKPFTSFPETFPVTFPQFLPPAPATNVRLENNVCFDCGF